MQTIGHFQALYLTKLREERYLLALFLVRKGWENIDELMSFACFEHPLKTLRLIMPVEQSNYMLRLREKQP
ncbi:MAG: hypothetical protein V7727_22405, partial [Sneathiella sp.]